MVATIDRELLAVSEEERAVLRAVEEMVQKEVELTSTAGGSISLPKSLRGLLRQAVHELLRGNRIALVPVGTMLTTQQAAEFLNVSRPFLIRLLEQGDLPHEMVGTHRRIPLEDVLRFRTARSGQRRESLRRLSQEADELDIYVE